jgi:hypothetical protein
MPHIGSIRLVNVQFNNATQIYDDFQMVLGGGNTTYDLENGGGKSLLLQMLFQTVLPKSYLRREKPLSLLFQGGKERTSHVAVEWILEAESPYQYLLTGFCARKRKGSGDSVGREAAEEEPNFQSSEIEHLNWCVFYNDHQTAGINLAPLVAETGGRKIYAGFEEVRKYIQQLKQKGLPAEIFDSIDRYQRYIAAQQLITAEWKIIKGINSGENNIESYFRQNTTSRKLIEDQFVKIVEDVEASHRNGVNQDASLLLADTLIEIRSRLNEYLKLKGHMAEFEKIKEYYSEFKQRNDGLYQAFQTFESWRRQAVAFRNLIGHKLTALEQAWEEATRRLEDNRQSYREGVQLQRQTEAGLVNYQKEQLLLEKGRLEGERDRYAELQAGLDRQYNELLTLEAYAEYRAVKAKLLVNRRRIAGLQESGDSLTDHYRQAGGKLRFLLDGRVRELQAQQTEAARLQAELEERRRTNQQEIVATGKAEALAEDEILRLGQTETKLGAEFKALNDWFLDRGEMAAALTPQDSLARVGPELDGCLAEHEAVIEQIGAADSRLRQMELEKVKIEAEIRTAQAAQKQAEDWRQDYQRELAALERQAADFGRNTIAEYRAGLELLLHQESLKQLEKEIELGRMHQKKQLAEDRGYYVPNEAILALTEQLSTKCEFAKAGIEWLSELEPAARTSLLQELPYLPFAVIVDRGSFAKLQNKRLKLDFTSDYALPIVNLEAVRLPDNRAREDLYYFCSFTELLINSDAYDRYLQTVATSVRSLSDEIAGFSERSAGLNAALSKVDRFWTAYSRERVAANQASLASLAQGLAEWERRQLGLAEETKRLLAQKGVLTAKTEDLTELAEEYREKMARLQQLLVTGAELDNLRGQLASGRKELTAVQQKIAGLNAARDHDEQQAQSLYTKINEFMVELHDLDHSRQELSGFDVVANQVTLTEAVVEYQALKEQMSGRMAEEDDLRSQIVENESRMAQLQTRVFRDYGGNLEEVASGEAAGELVSVPTPELIAQVKLGRETNAGKLTAATAVVNQIEFKIENLKGSLTVILKELPPEARDGLPCYDSVERYQQELELVGQLIRSYREGSDTAQAELEKISAESGKLTRQAEDYEAFLAREAVVNDGAVATELKDFRQFEQEYRLDREEVDRRLVKWDDRIKAVQAETITFVIQEPLKELVRITRPSGAAQSRDRQAAFGEYLANLEEQIRKINEDILKLESYQQDFTCRCIQRAELVLGQLRKIEALSKIEVYGKRVHMIELKLPEFEEKEQQLRMTTHIDNIIKTIGAENTLDRKRIAASLATKELLAQITDLDKAAVRLYKVESLPENCRYYRWEHAIGSEGQNNSLYFIFAVCLISFIRMLSGANAALRTKKVIIADNPFGATSAPYLWEPMFKIMKQNDIQLIAPGHRIPREITAKFGVSYLLNQEILQDGRLRVVVKDVRVEEEEERLRYIEPEQMGLF